MHTRTQLPRRQEGVVLMIALIVLVAMTLAGLGLIRSIDTGTLVSGNIGFRESAVASGDSGIELARAWLMNNRNSLNSDQSLSGYYSTRQDSVDLTGNKTVGTADGVDWGGSNPSAPVKAFDAGTTVDGTGNHIYYLIQRLCAVPGSINAPAQDCTTIAIAGMGSTQNAPDYSAYALSLKNEVYYRITSRIEGPKNTVSFVQAIVLI
jgi:type IV pilus assembly protein PilX